MRWVAASGVALLLAVGAAACGRGTHPAVVAGGDPTQGKQLIEHYGCGACHAIAGVPDANGQVGPDLRDWVHKHIVGGVLPNTIPNVEKWLEDPPRYSPRTTMPNLGVTKQQARDITAYLYGQ